MNGPMTFTWGQKQEEEGETDQSNAALYERVIEERIDCIVWDNTTN